MQLSHHKLVPKRLLPIEKKLSRDAIVTLVIHGCYQFGASMAGVFLQLYLWRLSHDLFVNGTYSIIVFLIGPIAFALGGKIAKLKDRLFVYRLGILLTTIFYMFVIIAKENILDVYYIFAVFNGICGAFYWIGYLTLMYDVSTDQNRIRYLGLNSISFNAAGLAGPALAGFIIAQNQGLTGYITVFSIAFIMFVFTAAGSFRLKMDTTHHKVYYLKMMGLLIRKNNQFLKGLYGWFTIGLMQGLMIFLPNILLFTVLAREDLVGYMGVIFLGMTIITSYILSRYAQQHHAKLFILIAAAGYTLSASFLIWNISTLTVICFIGLYFICAPLQMNSYSAYHYRLVGRLPLKGHLRVETMVLRETFINLGRVLSIVAVVFLAESVTGGWLPWIVLFAALMQFNFMWMINKEEPGAAHPRTR